MRAKLSLAVVVPALIMTAQAWGDDIRAAMEAGIDGFMVDVGSASLADLEFQAMSTAAANIGSNSDHGYLPINGKRDIKQTGFIRLIMAGAA